LGRERRLACKLLESASVRPTQRRINRGFTLVELMAVVAIVAILATLATYGVNKYIQSSKSSEAIQMIGSIKAAQEQYRAETFAYLDVSGSHALTNHYPATSPSKSVYGWGDTSTAQGKKFLELGVVADAPVHFVYACAAGDGSSSVPPAGMTVANWPSTMQQPWYVVQALGDLDGDGVKSTFVSSSFTSRIFTDKEGE
jgi:prepilin-type N-terminal cleavage/methylation domain-containing protein